MDGTDENVVQLHAAGGRSAKGARPDQQDEFIILPPEELPSSVNEEVAFFGVFDGHGSDAVSKHAKAHLPNLIFESAGFQAGQYESALQSAIDQEDRLLLRGFKDGENRFAVSGSTASVAVLDVKRGVLVIGNVGDSHILMAERDTGTGSVVNIQRLTQDHKPEDVKEKERIEQAGGHIHCRNDTSRIGSLNMSRALGDLQYKNPLNKIAAVRQTDSQQIACHDPSEVTDDFVTVQMSFKRITLSQDKQYILVLTSDGLTNAADDDQILRDVGNALNDGLSAGLVAQRMVDQTECRPGSDNVTCIVVFVNGVRAPPY